MKLIKSRAPDDCGVVALAVVAGCSYYQALKALFPDQRFWWWSKLNTGGKGISHQLVDDALDRLGITWRFTITSDECFGVNPALIAVKSAYHSGDTLHAVVWDPEQQRILESSRGELYTVDYCKANFVEGTIVFKENK